MYNCGFSADSQVRNDFNLTNPGAPDEEIAQMMQDFDYEYIALGNVKKWLQTSMEGFHPDYRLYIHGGGNFREQAATIKPYKGNRDPTHKPKYSAEIKKYMTDVWNALVVTGIETDDAIAIDQFSADDKSTVIVSIDKDLLYGVPGWSYNPRTGVLEYTTPTAANKFLFWQMLVGDSADNIPGIRGIGPKKASAALDKYDSMSEWRNVVQEFYKKEYGDNWKAAYTEVGTLLYILRRQGEEKTGCPLL